MKTFKLLNFKLKKNLWVDIFWAYKSAFHWSWLEFAEHKQYIPWDEIKHIDWKASAKSNKIFVKKYEEQKHLNVLFVFHLNESFKAFKNKFNILKELFFLLAFSAIYNNDSIVGLVGNDFTPSWSNAYLVSMILEKIENTQKYVLLDEILEKIKNFKNHVIFLFTDEDKLTEKQIKLLKRIQLKNELIFVNVFDEFENNLANIGSFLDLKTNKPLTVNLANTNKIKQYQKLREEKLNKLKNLLVSKWIDYLYISSNMDVFKTVYKFFMNKI